MTEPRPTVSASEAAWRCGLPSPEGTDRVCLEDLLGDPAECEVPWIELLGMRTV